jgi:hypothetical protein
MAVPFDVFKGEDLDPELTVFLELTKLSLEVSSKE